ncbi:MAG: tRNA (adenosine(37)-N6)-dimethylallyltransferase MiaA [Candidatus Omnitrophota bacterium]
MKSLSNRKPVYFIVGPTAAGKSAVALALAKKVRGEIISADSMQIYRGMTIGTGKPSKAERRRIRHHLIDILPPAREFSAHAFRVRALKALREIVRRGRTPIVAGGTGLYVRALLEGLAPPLGKVSSLRKRLRAEARRDGLAALYAELRRADPAYAQKISPTDERRIVRGLEILRASGKCPSEWFRTKTSLDALGYAPKVFGLHLDRPVLYARIDRRVAGMFRRGLVREVSRLLRTRISKTARQALGYKELTEVLKEPRLTAGVRKEKIRAAMELVQKNTRHYAKRQITWFKKEPGLVWIDGARESSARALADAILARSEPSAKGTSDAG